ncbi:WAP four-disulfide core domain protein 2-like [Zophobas morio]|uniref:WAP four-disulfide core domain protein 2-like n=1 Tax=Zophobas morio TaxID=2755281 RepID=UPI0030831C9F
MYKQIFVVFSLILLVYGQNGPIKAGDCPPLSDVGVCEVNCFSDTHCMGPMKCCPTACGGTFCAKPVTMRRAQIQEKPGFCPESPMGPWVCSSRCALDSDCRGTKKCCRNRCGAMACTKPEV